MLNKDRRDAIAVFDVGTNTVLYLLMTRGADGEFIVEDEGFAPTRLGLGLASGEPSATTNPPRVPTSAATSSNTADTDPAWASSGTDPSSMVAFLPSVSGTRRTT